MTAMKSPLDAIRIAKPCSADWAKMTGDERVRRCSLCDKDVYDLSAMERGEAEEFVRTREGRTCVRFWRRADGRFLTQDCPVGVRAAARRMGWAAAAAFAGVVIALALLFPTRSDTRDRPAPGSVREFFERLFGVEPPPPSGLVVMGEMTCPTPPPVAPTK